MRSQVLEGADVAVQKETGVSCEDATVIIAAGEELILQALMGSIECVRGSRRKW